MRIFLSFLSCLFLFFNSDAQTKQKSLEQRITELEERIAIKNVVDHFSNLADKKDIDQQIVLFTEDGIVESIFPGTPAIKLIGREQIKESFSRFLSGFHTVYHQNGQQTIEELSSTTAKATSYCQVQLVGEQNGKTTKTILYTIYKDIFEKQNGQWLIKHRTSHFIRREVQELN